MLCNERTKWEKWFDRLSELFEQCGGYTAAVTVSVPSPGLSIESVYIICERNDCLISWSFVRSDDGERFYTPCFLSYKSNSRSNIFILFYFALVRFVRSSSYIANAICVLHVCCIWTVWFDALSSLLILYWECVVLSVNHRHTESVFLFRFEFEATVQWTSVRSVLWLW